MYALINQHIQIILRSIAPDHATEYDWLIQNVSQAGTAEYQANYRQYWAMNAARLSPAYCATYFQELQAALTNPPALRSLVGKLYKTPTQGSGKQSLQFSFATKLLHTANCQSPIYDSFVAAFYFFQAPDSGRPLEGRITELVAFHDFLCKEYERVLANGLLAESIQAFRSQFNPQHFTEEKIIDSLIWAYVGLLNNGGLTEGRIVFR